MNLSEFSADGPNTDLDHLILHFLEGHDETKGLPSLRNFRQSHRSFLRKIFFRHVTSLGTYFSSSGRAGGRAMRPRLARLRIRKRLTSCCAPFDDCKQDDPTHFESPGPDLLKLAAGNAVQKLLDPLLRLFPHNRALVFPSDESMLKKVQTLCPNQHIGSRSVAILSASRKGSIHCSHRIPLGYTQPASTLLQRPHKGSVRSDIRGGRVRTEQEVYINSFFTSKLTATPGSPNALFPIVACANFSFAHR